MHGMEAVQSFAQAQRDCGRMWHAMRYARLNLQELRARRWASRKDLVEAAVMIKSTRELYLQALQRLFDCHADLVRGD